MISYTLTQTQSTGLRHPSFGGRCRKAMFGIIIIHSFYIALFSALEQTHCAHVDVILNEWLQPFIARIFYIHGNGVLIALFGCCMAGATWNAIQPYTSLQYHFIQSHIGRVSVCLAVTCHLHFWQNDLDLLRATAVTRGWNGYRNKTKSKVQSQNVSCRSCSFNVLHAHEKYSMRRIVPLN